MALSSVPVPAALRPGVHVLRRDRDRLQVGLDPDHAVALPDTAATRVVLDALATGRADLSGVPDPERVVPRLARGGLLGAADVVARALEPTEATGRLRHDVAALARIDPRGTDRWVRRRAALVALHPFGGDRGRALADQLGALLAGAGVRVADDSDAEPDLRVVAGIGLPERELLDPWLRAGHPHLVLAVSEGEPQLGPLVVPGETACLRCVDAHRAESDPRWPLLVAQYAARDGADRADGVPEPVDSLLAALAAAWLARDVVTWLEGRRPSTWSTTVRLHPDLASVASTFWRPHPSCGCSWARDDVRQASSVTLGA